MRGLLLAFFLASAVTSGRADQASDIVSFVAKVATACKAKDVEAIKPLYAFESVPAVLVDQNIHQWEDYFSSAGYYATMAFADARYASLADYRARPEVNQAAVDGSVRFVCQTRKDP